MAFLIDIHETPDVAETPGVFLRTLVDTALRTLARARQVCSVIRPDVNSVSHNMPATPTQTLAHDLLNRLDALILDAERQTKPLELEPYRSQLFELFVIADASGLMRDGSNPDLSPEGLSRELGDRWGLKSAAQTTQQMQGKLSPEHLSKMRLLWSFLRMWMEWQYAWTRWVEFHDRPATPHPVVAATRTEP